MFNNAAYTCKFKRTYTHAVTHVAHIHKHTTMQSHAYKYLFIHHNLKTHLFTYTFKSTYYISKYNYASINTLKKTKHYK